MRLESTGVLKGFMIFLIATEEPVSWSFAELGTRVRDERCEDGLVQTIRGQRHLCGDGEHTARVEGKADAPMPTGWRST